MARKIKASEKKPALAVDSGKHKVLHVNAGKGSEARLLAVFRNAAWQSVTMAPDPKIKPDLVGSITDFSAVRDGSMDAVWLSREPDMLPAHLVVPAFKECLRVLKQGGQVFIAVGDAQRVCEEIGRYARLEEELFAVGKAKISPLDVLFGVRNLLEKGQAAQPKTCFIATTLGRKLKDAGFVNIQVKRDGIHLRAVAQKLPLSAKGVSDKIMIIDENAPTGQPEELDVPPKQWAPLNLKKK